MNILLKKYESWLGVVEAHYTINQEVATVYEQWVRLVDSEFSSRMSKGVKINICPDTLKAILEDAISNSAPYAIGAARYGYEFTLSSNDFVYLLPFTVAALLEKVGKSLPYSEFDEKAAGILDIVDMDVQVKKILYSAHTYL